MDYWSRLKHLKMYSHQRRAERYRIIYTWKVLERIVPNFGIQHHEHIKRGRECSLPPLKGKQSIRTLCDQSFQINGPRLFNSLPKKLREIKKVSTDNFKKELDDFLATVPDNPKIGDQVPHTCNQITAKPSNSLIDVIQHQKTVYGGG